MRSEDSWQVLVGAGRPGKVVALSDADAGRLQAAADLRGVNLADMLARVIRSYRPDTTAAERQRRRRERIRKAQAGKAGA